MCALINMEILRSVKKINYEANGVLDQLVRVFKKQYENFMVFEVSLMIVAPKLLYDVMRSLQPRSTKSNITRPVNFRAGPTWPTIPYD